MPSEKYWLEVCIIHMPILAILLKIVFFCEQVALHKDMSIAGERRLAIILIVIKYIFHKI